MRKLKSKGSEDEDKDVVVVVIIAAALCEKKKERHGGTNGCDSEEGVGPSIVIHIITSIDYGELHSIPNTNTLNTLNTT